MTAFDPKDLAPSIIPKLIADLHSAKERVQADLRMIDGLLAVLEGDATVTHPVEIETPPLEEEPVLIEEEDEGPVRVVTGVTTIVTCQNGCDSWPEGTQDRCPVCQGTATIVLPHLQPQAEEEGGELEAVEPHTGKVTAEKLRDWIVSTHKDGSPFPAREPAAFFRCSQSTIIPLLDQLADQDIAVCEDKIRGGRIWRYNVEIPKDAPRRAPRGEPRIVALPGGRGRSVAGTGKPVGPSGKPGLDKRRAAAAKAGGQAAKVR